MNKERYNQLIDEAYENYSKEYEKDNSVGTTLLIKRVDGKSVYRKPDREMFIAMRTYDKTFSERWGLKIEERELSESEIWDYIHKNDIKIKHQHAVLYSHEVGSELRSSFVQTLKENYNIPTKLITVTYKNEKTEIYE